ncbi:ABC transporter permease [Halobellus marinus]|uniref:ABC transporter permease n=1 Tax=Halobellus TaxID=1073986 RepID=UPI0028A98DAB|nr:ABC transporter permease [Halobellus sp. DFY28]
MSTSDLTQYRDALRRAGNQTYEFLKPALKQRWSRWGLYVIAIYVLLGIFGPYLPLPEAFTSVQGANGGYAKLSRPSLAHPLGTTSLAYSVLARTLYSFRTSLLVGLLSALLVIGIGVNVGLVAGYYGGRVESVFMGLTDLMFGLPFYPFAIVLIAILGSSMINVAIVIALVFWREIARVTRSETLSLKERTYIKSARAAGSSNLKIMYYHILPNLMPLILIYFVFGITWGILLEASLSFIGLGDPDTVSWGLMLHNAFSAGALTQAWWWVIPPALALWLFIWSLYVVARALEDNIDTNVEGGA